jgi:hypothetical protein
MSDPTIATGIITTGTATVSVIGSDGSGKSKVLTAAEVRTAAETISESAIGTLLDTKASITNRREYFPTIAHAADTEHDLTLGAARIWVSDGSTERLIDFASLTKRIDASWAAGTNQGGLDTGTVGNSTWYYLWAIYNPTTLVADYLISASTSAPTMPSGYTFKRFLCEKIAAAVLTDSSANLRQAVFDGRICKWTNSGLLIDLSTTSPATARTTISVSVPNVTCRYLCRISATNNASGAFVLLYDRNAGESDILVRSLATVISYAIGSVRSVGQQIDYLASTAADWTSINMRSLGYEV